MRRHACTRRDEAQDDNLSEDGRQREALSGAKSMNEIHGPELREGGDQLREGRDESEREVRRSEKNGVG